MGTLFADDEEYPAHPPIPSSFPSGKNTVTTLLLGVGPYALCPAHEAHAEVPHHDHAPVPHPVSYVGVNSTTPGTPFFGNTLDAAGVAIQAGYAKRRAQAAVAGIFSTTSHALLQSDDENGATLDWLPTFPSSTGR